LVQAFLLHRSMRETAILGAITAGTIDVIVTHVWCAPLHCPHKSNSGNWWRRAS
jgi:hypothetical protein